MSQQIQEYFKNIGFDNPKSTQKAKLIRNLQQKLQQSILTGEVSVDDHTSEVGLKKSRAIHSNPEQIKHKISSIQKLIYQKNLELSEEMKKLDISSKRSTYIINDIKKESRNSLIIKRRHTDIDQNHHFQRSESQRRDAFRRLRKLKEEKKQFQHKKLQIQTQKDKKQKQIAQKIKREQQEQSLYEKQKKKALIKQRLEKLQQYKNKRHEILSSKSVPILRKYKEAEKKFILNEIKHEIQTKLQQKFKRQAHLKQFDSESIKQHQKQYINRIKEKYGLSRVKTLQTENDFVLNQSKFKENIEMIKQRIEKKLLFQEKLKKMRIKTSIQKNNEVEIAKDKAKNPFKYNFLRQKDLSDQQIFEQFKSFNLDLDRKKIGDDYLQEVKKFVNESRVKTIESSRRIATTGPTSQNEKKSYKNYLLDLKLKPESKNQIRKIINSNQKRSKVLEVLQKKSKDHQKIAMKKIKQLKTSMPYEKTSKIEEQIDSEYIQSLKGKIAYIQIQQ